MVWVGSSLFDYGISSIDLIAFKQRVQKRLALGMEIPVVMITKNPTIRGMADALNSLFRGPQPYNPVVLLQSQGAKTPLWLVHPGTGEILLYLILVRFITDRPLYALRSRGLEKGEEYSHSLPEAVKIYHSHIKKTQPTGPYAIVGYSQGSIIAFEVAKLLEGECDKVALCGALDLPSNVSVMLGQPGFADILIQVSYFLELTTREHAFEIRDSLRKCTHEEALTHILELAPVNRREELHLDHPKLLKWVEISKSLIDMIVDYEPSGEVEAMDVFYAGTWGLIAQEIWLGDYLKRWNGFTRTGARLHACEGEHHTMLTAANIFSFQNTLKTVLRERGI